MGTATFFGSPSTTAAAAALDGTADDAARKAAATARALEIARLPLPTSFDQAAEYLYQDELDINSSEQWAVLQLEHPVACALPATAICSHLETDYNLNTCRIAFYGRLLKAVAPEHVHALRVFKWKRKEGQVRLAPYVAPFPCPSPLCESLTVAGAGTQPLFSRKGGRCR
jgi:selenocysteine-specific elongation factor